MAHLKLRFTPAALFVCVALVLSAQAATQAETNPWHVPAELGANALASQTWLQPDTSLQFDLDQSILENILIQAPKETSGKALVNDRIVTLPLPDGTFSNFRFLESSVMAPELAAKFPEIRTFVGQCLENPAITVRFDSTPSGFHAQILSPDGASYIDPYLRGNSRLHVCYFKRDYKSAAKEFQCLSSEPDAKMSSTMAQPASGVSLNGNLRTYRLACAATGEYTTHYGGTVASAMSGIVTAVNRVTGIYETELGIRLVLVANNNLLVYTNSATDPYTDGNPSALLTQNQSNLDTIIGNANYDIGHVFGTGGGGLASVGVVCVTGLKAHGETGMYPPTGDAFWVDYVAHEIGHQFGATHSFNSTSGACNGNRCASTAYEPGSGSTIMAYAGICGSDNLQAHSNPYFHAASFEQIMNFVTGGAGSGGGTATMTGNHSPVVSAGASYTIPAGTPFTLTASGSDPDADGLTWCWEERDLGPAASLAATDNGSSPLFRSVTPVASPSRTFPQLSDILNNTSTPGERLTSTNRTMNFRVTARDNRAGGGGVASADMQVTIVASAGPFRITSPTNGTSWSGQGTITWNVAGTAAVPINAANVNIFLSSDGGQTFPFLLASNLPNTGTATISLPNISTASARVKVQGSDNIFFDISHGNFSITPGFAKVTPTLLLSLRLSNGLAWLNWNSETGRTYRVQYQDWLGAGWSNALPDIISSNSTTVVSCSMGAAPHRFYRVWQVQ
jgi:Metallo-peptidase family M12B Reprolysin-like